jgi:hypothetical protein
MGFKVEIDITDEDIQDVINSANDWFGVVVTPEIVKAVCEKDSDFAVELSNFGGSDTETRSAFIESFAENFLEVSPSKWPMGMDSEDYKIKFYKAFYAGCEAKGVKLHWTLEEVLNFYNSDIPKHFDVMTVGDFKAEVQSGALTSDDGHGYPVKNNKMNTNFKLPGNIPEDATHVAWANK